MTQIKLLSLLLFFYWTNPKTTTTAKHSATDSILTVLQASQILGESAKLMTRHTLREDGNVNRTRLLYIANGNGTTGITGALNYMYESYDNVSAAQRKYNEIKKSNIRLTGFTELRGVGDEAWEQKDDGHFFVVIIRKANRMIRIKVNKIPKNAQFDVFTRVAKQMAAGF